MRLKWLVVVAGLLIAADLLLYKCQVIYTRR
jgi:hypothetical protein